MKYLKLYNDLTQNLNNHEKNADTTTLTGFFAQLLHYFDS